MGYGLEPIAVDLRRVSRAIGSKDEDLLAAVVDEFSDGFAEVDEMAADFVDEEDEDGGEPLTVEAALTHLIMGEPYDEQFGFVYGYALQYLCLHFGERLSNEQWSAMPSATRWIDKVDRHLKTAGVPAAAFRVADHLVYRGPPVRLPSIDDAPSIGYLTRDEIKAARAALAAATTARIDDAEVRASVEEAERWLKTCADAGRDLICYCF